MRRLSILLILLVLGTLGWVGWKYYPEASGAEDFFKEKIGFSDFKIFKIQHSAEEIMETHKKELLKSASSSFLEAELSFYPYLLMEVKYSHETGVSKEAMLLWGLSDGEMVLNTANWEKTHGFEDCLRAKVDENEFKILRALIESGGSVEREKIVQKFKGEKPKLAEWIENCHKKKLVVESGGKLRIHLQNPKLALEPRSSLDATVVTMPHTHAPKGKKRYSHSALKNLAEAAFGSDFAIRRVEEVYLPVYTIAVENSDGSIFTTYWNALNGKKIDEHLREL